MRKSITPFNQTTITASPTSRRPRVVVVSGLSRTTRRELPFRARGEQRNLRLSSLALVDQAQRNPNVDGGSFASF